jgi:hypothetical protein
MLPAASTGRRRHRTQQQKGKGVLHDVHLFGEGSEDAGRDPLELCALAMTAAGMKARNDRARPSNTGVLDQTLGADLYHGSDVHRVYETDLVRPRTFVVGIGKKCPVFGRPILVTPYTTLAASPTGAASCWLSIVDPVSLSPEASLKPHRDPSQARSVTML